MDKTVKVSDGVHSALVKKKKEVGAVTLSEVINILLERDKHAV